MNCSSAAVIGGGIIGLSCAWRLAQRGRAVTLYEKTTVGGEASWAGAGMLAPGGEFDSASALTALALESRALYAGFVRELESASGLSIDYQECGGLDLAYSEEELAALNLRASRQLEIGIPSKLVSPAHVQTFWPRVRTEGLAGARFYPGDGLVNPRETTDALRIACHRTSVDIREGQEVLALDVRAGGICVNGSDRYGAAVVAAGAWSGSLAVSGVPPLPWSEPVKGHLVGYQQPAQTCNTILRHGHTYVVQRANGMLIVGSSVEHAGFDRSVRQDLASTLAQQAEFLLPHLQETTPSETWIGFRPGAHGLQLGPWHSERLFLAYGHFRNGILLAPVTAQRIASLAA